MRGSFIALLLAGVAPAGAQPAPRQVELVVASTTDVHGRLRAWDYYANGGDSARGLARAATIVDSLRRAHPGRVLLVDAGDLLQGNPLTYVAARVDTAGPHPVIAAMNAMGYDAAAVGNHEFNYGLPTLRAALRGARFPFLAANAVPLGRERGRPPLFAPFRIVQREGIRVGIVGATTPGSMVWDRDNLAGRLRVGDIVPAVRRAVAEVRRRGVSAVVVVMHTGLDGASSYDTVSTRLPSENVAARVAREVPGVDLIVFGHSHRELADSTINGVLLMQPRNWATSVGVATLTLERQGTSWRVTRKRGVLVRAARHAEHPGVVAAVERAHQAAVGWVNQTLGTTAAPWRADSARVTDTPLIDFILEVQRRTAGADLAATAAFDINASLDAGPVTVAEVARLYPYDNTLRAIRISGKQLREFLEFSSRYYRTLGSPEAAQSVVDPSVPGFNFDIVAGADYELDLSRPLGQRVTRLMVKGVPVRETDTFTMALNNYRQSGGGGFAMLGGAPVVYDRQEEIRDLLIAEVKRRGELRPADFHVANWRLAPANVVEVAWRAMRALPYDRSTDAVRAPAAGSEHLATGRWLRVIGTSDFHGALAPLDFSAEGILRGGAASLMAAITRARGECRPPTCASLWVDGGDQWQGTPASNLTYGRPVVAIFNQFGLAAAALGNHELDWGQDTLRARMREARYPLLAANILDSAGRDVAWIPDDTLVDAGGTRVGVIGVITQAALTTQRPAHMRGLQVVPPESIVAARARALRARGAEAVIVVAHVGALCERGSLSACSGEAMEMARALDGQVDAVVAGHTHRPAATLVGRVALAQAYQRGSAIGVIDIPLGGGGAPARIALRNVRPDSIPGDSSVAVYVDSITSAHEARFAEPVATLAQVMRRGDNGTLGELVADAQRHVVGADVAVMNRGGVRADLKAGPVTWGDAFLVLPFDNQLVQIRVRGDALLAYVERLLSRASVGFHLSGMRVEYDARRPAGRRVVRATMSDGSPLDPRREYTLAMSDFLAEGGDGMALGAQAVSTEPTPELLRDALVKYLRALPQPVRAPAGGRIVRIPE
jgi:2',3'-cyclic-nucleotide 2'-phosphodiesterase/3'-nucleotidase/5'-nucleotidase